MNDEVRAILRRIKDKRKQGKLIQNHPIKQNTAILWMLASLYQGRRLADDAKLLLSRKRLGSALSQLCLSLEETSKFNLLFEYAFLTPMDQSSWNKTRLALTSHDHKIETTFKSMFLILKDLKNKTPPELANFDKLDFNIFDAWKNAREMGLYTSVLNDEILVPESFARMIGKLDELVEFSIFLPKYFISISDHFAPSVTKYSKKYFTAKTEEEKKNFRKKFNKDLGRHLYLLSFIKSRFPDPLQTIILIYGGKHSKTVLRRITNKPSSQKYRLTFEILQKTNLLDNKTLVNLLVSKELPKVAGKIMQEVRSRELLL